MKYKNIIISLALIFAFGCYSCDNWLNVKPDDKVSEEEVFSSIEGFRNALNAIYIEMNAADLYGKSLGSELVEVMGQRYNVNTEWTEMTSVMEFRYKSSSVIRRFEGVWTSAYALISNINHILKNCEERREVLVGDNYNLIKGEALALRAYLHFDLFRLFGPVYSSDTTAVSLPFYPEFSFTANELLPGHEFLQLVIADLETAGKLLEVDPIIQKGPSWSEDMYDQNRNRVSRMNYYAVQLLRARVELYAGHKKQALAAAVKVIGVQEDYFPFTPASDVSAGTDNPDRLFSSELVFALENPQRATIYNSLFNPENVKLENLLLVRQNKLDALFTEDRDYRYKAWFPQEKTVGGVACRVFHKLADVANVDLKFNILLPMLRVSEAYYIAAECEENPAEGLKYLNSVLNNRGLESEKKEELLQDYLTLEYRREFFGEGQLFFYYKRLNEERIPDAVSDWENEVRMTKTEYVVPLPESEIKYRDMTNQDKAL